MQNQLEEILYILEIPVTKYIRVYNKYNASCACKTLVDLLAGESNRDNRCNVSC